MSNLNLNENAIQLAIDRIKKTNPNLKESTQKTYMRLLRKFYGDISINKKDMRIVDGIPMCLYEAQDIIKYFNTSDWGKALKDRSRKNYLSLILTLFRGLKETKQGVYDDYRKEFDKLKDQLDTQQIKQQPTEEELQLKDLKFDNLKKALNYHYNKVRKGGATDLESALLNLLGHLHIDQVLRNEACDMIMSEHYLTEEDHPNQNFIWLKGRNAKLMVIRNNKVRNPARGDKAKEVYLKGSINTAINKYLQVLENNDEPIPNGDNTYPLVHSKTYKDKGCISSSHYSQLFKKIWSHIGLTLTSTMIRKTYAMDMRDKFKGNLLKEKEACEKLDHSKDTHDKHYILFF